MYRYHKHNPEELLKAPSELPKFCTADGCACQRIHKHSRCKRKCVFGAQGWQEGLETQRFRCAECKTIMHMFIAGLHKWQRVDAAIQQSAVLNQAPAELHESVSQRTIVRWKQQWTRRAETVMQGIMQWAFRVRNDLEINQAPHVANSPIRYLEALLAQMPCEVPCAVELISAIIFGGCGMNKIPHFLSLVFGSSG
jgi:hypothetical protein